MEPGEPKFKEDERISGLMKVVGASPEDEGAAKEKMKDVFDKQEKSAFRPEWEIEKTDEEKKLIEQVLEKLPDFVRRFSGKPFQIKSENIHFLDKKKIESANEFKENFEQYDWENQQIAICPEEGGITTAEHLVHELLHFESFMSLTKHESDGKGETGNIRRLGTLIVGKGKWMLGGLNEGITQELAIRFLREHYDDPRIGKIIGNRQIGIRYIGGVEFRIGEVARFRKIVADVFKENPNDFESEEDVFNLFAEGYFTGKLLKMARIIEKTYGKGSFKRMAEEGEPKEDFFTLE